MLKDRAGTFATGTVLLEAGRPANAANISDGHFDILVCRGAVNGVEGIDGSLYCSTEHVRHGVLWPARPFAPPYAHC